MLRGAAVLAALLAALRPAAVLTTAAVLTSVSAAWACPGEQTVPAVPRGDLTYWSAFQQRLATEVSQADKAEGFDVAFYGDSIFEHWLGTSQGTPWKQSEAVVSQYERAFGNASDFSSRVLAIAGDDLANLWWRVQQGGEWPAVHLPKLAVLLIGTNDLSNADCTQTEDALLAAVPGVLTRMNGVLGAISNAPHIAIVGLLPRGAAFWEREQQWVYPNRYTNAVQYVNQGFAAIAGTNASRFTYVDCGDLFVNSTGLQHENLSEGLHPSTVGNELLINCLMPVVRAHAARPAVT